MDHTIIPAQWKTFLSKLQTLFPSAIIAGGALRDTICNNSVKDVDVFINDDRVNNLDSKININKFCNDIADIFHIEEVAIHHTAKAIEHNKDYVYCTHNIREWKKGLEVRAHVNPDYSSTLSQETITESVVNIIIDIRYNGELYQLIFVEMEPKLHCLNDFDFGICKVYYDGHAMVISDEFWYDYENKQLTISGKHSAGQLLHTMYVHRPALVKKFPNWKVVVEDIFKKEGDDLPPSSVRIKNKKAEAEEKVKPDALIVDFDDGGVERYTMTDINNAFKQFPPVQVPSSISPQEQYLVTNGPFNNSVTSTYDHDVQQKDILTKQILDVAQRVNGSIPNIYSTLDGIENQDSDLEEKIHHLKSLYVYIREAFFSQHGMYLNPTII